MEEASQMLLLKTGSPVHVVFMHVSCKFVLVFFFCQSSKRLWKIWEFIALLTYFTTFSLQYFFQKYLLNPLNINACSSWFRAAYICREPSAVKDERRNAPFKRFTVNTQQFVWSMESCIFYAFKKNTHRVLEDVWEREGRHSHGHDLPSQTGFDSIPSAAAPRLPAPAGDVVLIMIPPPPDCWGISLSSKLKIPRLNRMLGCRWGLVAVKTSSMFF